MELRKEVGGADLSELFSLTFDLNIYQAICPRVPWEWCDNSSEFWERTFLKADWISIKK